MPRGTNVAVCRILEPTLPEPLLLRIARVTVNPGWLDRRRVRVRCDQCGEGINYEREVIAAGRALCRACADGAYYIPCEAVEEGAMT